MPLSSPSSTASSTASGRERWNDWSAEAPSIAETVSSPSLRSACSSASTIASSCSTTRMRLPKTAGDITSVEGGRHRVHGGEHAPGENREHDQVPGIDLVPIHLCQHLVAHQLHLVAQRDLEAYHAVLIDRALSA